MNRKRIIFVVSHITMGGIIKSLINLCRVLTPEEYDITVLALADTKGLTDELPPYVKVLFASRNKTESFDKQYSQFWKKHYGSLVKHTFNKKIPTAIRVVLYQILKIENKQFIKYVKKLLENLTFDISVGYTHSDASNVAVFSINANKKYLFYHDGKIREHINDTDYYNKADRIVAVSQGVKNELIRKRHIPKEKVIVLHNIFDLKSIKEKAQVHCEFDETRKLKIGTIARISKEKGIIQAIQAAKILADSNIDFLWFIVGPGDKDFFETCEQLINNYNLNNYIVFTGSRDNPFPYIRTADIYVQPSEFEALPGTVVEAMVLEKPIVSTKNYGAEELITNGKNGLLCGFEPQDIAKTILRILDDDELKCRLAQSNKDSSSLFENEAEKYRKLFSL